MGKIQEMAQELSKRDIDFNIERRYQEATEVGDPVQKPHHFLGYPCEEPDQSYSTLEDKIGDRQEDLV